MIRVAAFTKLKLISRGLTRRFQAQNTPVTAVDNQSLYLAAIAKELRDPIATIAGYSEILAASLQDMETVDIRRDYHEAMLESSRQLQRLMDELTEVSQTERPTSAVAQPIDVAEMLEEAANLLREKAQLKQVSLILRVIEDVELVGDLRRLRKVFLRLMSDSIQAAPAGEIVAIEMRFLIGEGLEISFQGSAAWQPEVSFVRQIIESHGGRLDLGNANANDFEVRLIFPATKLRMPGRGFGQAKVAKLGEE